MDQDWSLHKCRKDGMAQSVTHGKKLPGESDLTFRTATGELVKSGENVIGESISEFEVFKRQCFFLSTIVCWIIHDDGWSHKSYMFHKFSNVAKKIDAWIQKEMRDSPYLLCTVAYKENNVHNIYMKPKGNKTDAMPLSEDSDNRSSGSCRPGPNL